eukprot:TRINITY_DN63112_c0_g1_i1.p2 TRINITY_DN63112_c0_g1~~TRINITY_DN63112_c0_g1_i1.p2  ORF type:complete len:173 (+),score=14.46 TRINITY_DN63112_c0_g1_i1:107-625(+)
MAVEEFPCSRGLPELSRTMQRNALHKTWSMNTAYLSQHVRFKGLESVHVQKGDPDYIWKSHATNFARGGVDFQGNNYTRDPRTGVWFKSSLHRFPGMDSGAPTAYRVKTPEGPVLTRACTSPAGMNKGPFGLHTTGHLSVPALDMTERRRRPVTQPHVLRGCSYQLFEREYK